ncbi:MAG TPA: hypothetical protein VFV48_07740, partial [Pseudomonadales bacterium]|nr:hypothetical protein [Pseudomonadales bacterium]
MGFTEQLVFIFGTDEVFSDFVSTCLANHNFQVRCFSDIHELGAACALELPFAVICCENIFVIQAYLSRLKQGVNSQRKRLPLIVVVDEANSFAAHVVAGQIGVDFFIGAPFEVQHLIQFLRQEENLLLERAPRLLIVDDVNATLLPLKEMLLLSGIEVRLVQQLDAIAPALDTFQPDLLLLD